ncbi:hypothetical protein EDB92DRAFT_1842570 [Lactarius akahatsu]|uniref:BTB domain-containing protein n=1 Tax=Lactarius akahatsu TaxID=416441 RepID=A0AAD4QG84_9AGAM|nr:hypothetical protein EDB92DRAFT_1842570 [Lactarius akahatsu]
MAPCVVFNDIPISPVLSSATSIVSFDSTFSDTYPNQLQMSPTASEASGLPSADLEANHSSPVGCSEGTKTPGGRHVTPPGDSFIRHDAYFFKDGNVTFLVGGTLYCVHRYFFSRDSVYFSTRFTQLGIRDYEPLPIIITIGDIERTDFEALLSVLYPANFEAHELRYEQWKSVLHLSTRWGFTSLRKLALKSIKPPTPHDQFVLARTYSVDHWVLPSLTALCERTLPLSLDEARQMSMEDVILVATAREEIHSGALRVDAAHIPRHVEVAQAGQPNRPMGDDTDWDGPNSGTTGKEPDSTIASGVDPNVEVEDVKTMGLSGGDIDGSDVERSLNEVPTESPGEGAMQGVEQPHVVEDIPQECLERVGATCAVRTKGTRELEEGSCETRAMPSAQAEEMSTRLFTMGAMPGNRQIRRFPRRPIKR